MAETEGLKIEFPAGMLEQQVTKGLQATILAGAAQHIMKSITPEHIHKFALDILGKGLSDLNDWEMRKYVIDQATPLVKAYSHRPEFVAKLEEAVKEGMEMLLKSLPDIVYQEMKEVVVTAITDRYNRRR